VQIDDRRIAQAIAWGRIGLGVTAMFAPRDVGGAMFGPGARDPEPTALARMAGVRDLYVGAVTLAALNGGVSAPVAVGLGAMCDAVDTWAGVAGQGLTGRARMLTALAAIPATVLGARAARGLRSAA